MSPFATPRSAAEPVDHLPYENTPRPGRRDGRALSERPAHRHAPHRRAQLLYAIEGVMQVTSETGAWVVPAHARRLARGRTRPRGADERRRADAHVFVEPSAALALRARTGVVDVPPLLRELIVAAIDVPLDYAPGSRDEHLMQLLLAELNSVPQLPLHLPWPSDARLRAVCDALLASPHDDRTITEWARQFGMSEKTLYPRLQPRDRHDLRALAPASAPAAGLETPRARREDPRRRARPRLSQPERLHQRCSSGISAWRPSAFYN